MIVKICEPDDTELEAFSERPSNQRNENIQIDAP